MPNTSAAPGAGLPTGASFVTSPRTGGAIDNGPYQGNLGDYTSPFREDNDNPLAPDWFRARQTSDPEGVVPLVDPQTGATVPQPGYNPGRFFGIDAQTLDPAWYHLDGFMAGGDWENGASRPKVYNHGRYRSSPYFGNLDRPTERSVFNGSHAALKSFWQKHGLRLN